jgi:hypothetical protein
MKSRMDKDTLWETKVLAVFENNCEMNSVGYDSETKDTRVPVLFSTKPIE